MNAPESLVTPRMACRLCGTRLPDPLIEFPALPVAGAYLDASAEGEVDPGYPLSLAACRNCGFVQLGESLSASFYSRYRFMSGVAAGYRRHLSAVAADLVDALEPGSRVLEIGASDGALLAMLRDGGMRVSGFEPAAGPCEAARNQGLPVENAYFDLAASSRLPRGAYDAIVIRHVLEHLNDLDTVLAGIGHTAAPGAILLVEVPDLVATIEESIYTNVYHLHAGYFAEETMRLLLARHGWRIEQSSIVDIFGASLLLAARRAGAGGNGFAPLVRSAGRPPRPFNAAALHAFVDRWKTDMAGTLAFFEGLRVGGASVAGYGAAERTTALVGMAGLGRNHLRAIYDKNPALQSLRLPVSRIPVLHPARLLEDRPDYLVVFARSFEREIVTEQAEYVRRGGKMISVRTLPPFHLNCAV